MSNTYRYALVVVLVLLILGGAVAGIWQLRCGLATTALHAPPVWGLYVVCFAYFAGIGAGALFVTSLALCSGGEEYKPIARAAGPIALVCLILAGVFITIDLGRPDRAILLVLKPQFSSPLIWDFLILNIMLAVAAIYTLVLLRVDLLRSGSPSGLLSRVLTVGGKPERIATVPSAIRFLAWVMVITVPILYVLTVRIFSSLRARPDWNTTGLSAVFLISAMLSGLAATCVAIGLWYRTEEQVSTPQLIRRVMRNGLIVLILVDLLLTLSPFASMRQFNSPSRLIIWSGISGATVLELVGGMLIPLFILLGFRRQLPGQLAAASVLILFGVFVKRWHVIVPAMLHRAIPFPKGSYTPNAVECTVSVGIVAFGILLLLLLMRPPGVRPASYRVR